MVAVLANRGYQHADDAMTDNLPVMVKLSKSLNGASTGAFALCENRDFPKTLARDFTPAFFPCSTEGETSWLFFRDITGAIS